MAGGMTKWQERGQERGVRCCYIVVKAKERKMLSTLIMSFPRGNDITGLPMRQKKPGRIVKSLISSDQ